MLFMMVTAIAATHALIHGGTEISPGCKGMLSISRSQPAIKIEAAAASRGRGEVDNVVRTLPRTRSAVSYVDTIPAPLHSLWMRDSTAIEYALALIVADVNSSTWDQSQAASVIYRAISGRARPILQVLTANENYSRRAQALEAIASVSDSLDIQTILYYGCQAAEKLIAFRSRPWLERSLARSSLEPFLEEAILEQSLTLLPSAQRETLASHARPRESR